jgi:hypothetical protein
MKKGYSVLPVLSFLMAACSVGSVQAQQVLAVDFGGPYAEVSINSSKKITYATGDCNFNGQENDRVSKVEFGSIFSPPRTGNWKTQKGKSNGTIYCGLSLAALGNPSMDLTDMMSRVGSDGRIQLGGKAAGATLRMAAALYWTVKDFLCGEDLVRLADAAGSMRAEVKNNGAPPSTRFLIQSGGVWYVSADRSFGASATLRSNGATASWHKFDPASNHLFLNEEDLGAAIPGSEIGPLTAIGIYAQTAEYPGDTGSFFGLSSLQVQVAP